MHPYTRKGRPHQANLLKQEAWRERGVSVEYMRPLN